MPNVGLYQLLYCRVLSESFSDKSDDDDDDDDYYDRQTDKHRAISSIRCQHIVTRAKKRINASISAVGQTYRNVRWPRFPPVLLHDESLAAYDVIPH